MSFFSSIFNTIISNNDIIILKKNLLNTILDHKLNYHDIDILTTINFKIFLATCIRFFTKNYKIY